MKYRRVPIKEFFILPEKNFRKENILEPGEMITRFIIPPSNFNFSHFIKVKERGAWDFAVVSVAVGAQKELLRISRAEFVFGGVAPIPWIDNNLNKAAKNFTNDPEFLAQLSDRAFQDPDPMDMNYYKIRLAKNLVIKSLI
jgi:xanthine dehydrogenase YagS FAD-binding subunit